MYSISSKIWSVLPKYGSVFPKSHLFLQKLIHSSRFWSIFQKFSYCSASFLSVLPKSDTFLQKIDQFTQNLIHSSKFWSILQKSDMFLPKNRSVLPKSNPFFQKRILTYLPKTSPKGFSASKCDVGNWIFSKSWEFFGNFWRMIVYIFKSQLVSYVFKVIWLFTFSKSADCLHFQSQLIFYILKVIWIWKKLICLPRFCFLSRFCLKAEGGRTRI